MPKAARVARIIAFILLTICNDIGGYATGVLFGRHPIAAQLSPKKSWEGFAGSVSRFESYHVRLTGALTRLDEGETRMFTGVMCGS